MREDKLGSVQDARPWQPEEGYPIRRGFGRRYVLPTAGRRSSFSGVHRPRARKPVPSSPQEAAKWSFSLHPAREQIENEIMSYVSSLYGPELAAAARPCVRAAIRTRPPVGVEPVVQLEAGQSDLRGTAGFDFPIDLTNLPLGKAAPLLIKEPKFYVRLESRVRFTKKRLKIRYIDAKVGFSARPTGSDTKDIHWGTTFKPRAGSRCDGAGASGGGYIPTTGSYSGLSYSRFYRVARIRFWAGSNPCHGGQVSGPGKSLKEADRLLPAQTLVPRPRPYSSA